MNTLRAIAVSLSIFAYFLGTNDAAHILQKRLVGGRDPTPEEARQHVGVVSGGTPCGGAVIGEKLVLTSAYCIGIDKNTGKLLKTRIIAGTTDLKKRESAIVANVTKVYIPSSYHPNDPQNRQLPVADIAVLELSESLNLEDNSDKVEKLELPQLVDGSYPNYENAPVLAGGFGFKYLNRTHDEDYNDVFIPWSGYQLQVGKSEVVTKERCQMQMRPYNLKDDLICVKVIENLRHAGPCGGDGGSPVIYNNKVIIGVLSLQDSSCDTDAYSAIYTRVSSHMEFIENVKNGNTADILTYEP